MIQVTITKNKQEYIGFDCTGHAGYAKAGEDIVCAGVSALVINTVNALARYTGAKFSTDADEKDGRISISFCPPIGHDAGLLMDAMVLGLEGIAGQYGQYMKLHFKEV